MFRKTSNKIIFLRRLFCKDTFFSSFCEIFSITVGLVQLRGASKHLGKLVLLTVDSMDVNRFVVLGLEGLAAVLARVLAALDVSRLHMVGDGLEA